MRPRREAVVVAAVLLLTLLAAATPAHAAFGVSSFTADVKDASDQPVAQAGAHPFVGVTKFSFNTVPLVGIPDGNVKDIRVDLPPGLISNPQATPRCLDTQFPGCPANTQVGTETLTVGTALLPVPSTVPIYNMETGPGEVSDFAFSAPVFGRTDIVGGLRDTGDFGLFFTISNTPQLANLLSSELTFWGVPSQHGGTSSVPFLSLPTACDGPQTTRLTVTSWNNETVTRNSVTPQGATGCDQVPFSPSISVAP